MQKIVADLHFHSRFSRATSPAMRLPELFRWARRKGINLLGSADFTHPFWLAELKKNLVDEGNGLFHLQGQDKTVKFILSAEISLIYTHAGRVRRIHLLVLMPSLESVARFNDRLSSIGNIYSDGRPILGISSHHLAQIALETDRRALIIPAHIWTPWFSALGSKSGYDSVKECFGDLTAHILAVETGLSADPAMCWRVSELDNFAILSNGDSHSLPNIMREATVFEIADSDALSYDLITRMLRNGSIKARTDILSSNPQHPASQLAYTIEFFPEEGKYHWSGHRACGYKTDHIDKISNAKFQISNKFQSQNSKFKTQDSNLCPICRKPITLGVLYRVNELADRPIGFQPPSAAPYKSFVQLTQIIAEALEIGETSQAVQREYTNLLQKFPNELYILESASLDDLRRQIVNDKITEGIQRVREGKIIIDPGFDGEYGKVRVFKESALPAQKSLF